MNTASFIESRSALAPGVVHGDPEIKGSLTRGGESPGLGFAQVLDSHSGGSKPKDLLPGNGSTEATARGNGKSEETTHGESHPCEKKDPSMEASEGSSVATDEGQPDLGLVEQPFDGRETEVVGSDRPSVSGVSMKRMEVVQEAKNPSTPIFSESPRRIALAVPKSTQPAATAKTGVAMKLEEASANGKDRKEPLSNAERRLSEATAKTGVAVKLEEVSVNGSGIKEASTKVEGMLSKAAVKTGIEGVTLMEAPVASLRERLLKGNGVKDDSKQGSNPELRVRLGGRGNNPVFSSGRPRFASTEGIAGEKRLFQQGSREAIAETKPSPSAPAHTLGKPVVSKDAGLSIPKLGVSDTFGGGRVDLSKVSDAMQLEQSEKTTPARQRLGLELLEKTTLPGRSTVLPKGVFSESASDKGIEGKPGVEGTPAQAAIRQTGVLPSESGKAAVFGNDDRAASKTLQSAKNARESDRNSSLTPSIHEIGRKSDLNAILVSTETRLTEGKSGIGTARALLDGESDQSSRVLMTKTVQKSDAKPWNQGLSDSAGVQESKGQHGVARVESAHAASSHGSNMGEQQGRGGTSETFRQYAQEIAESRSNVQAATQSQFMDRSVASQLSTVVVNQILNHLEKLRESERGRVRVNLGSEDSGALSVQISVSGGVVRTVFEGDESVLRQLESDWQWIQSRASQRGVALEQPQYFSNSLVSGGASLFPDDAMLTGNQSQSVIQQSENQPVRPEFQTAVSGNSGPVHLYA